MSPVVAHFSTTDFAGGAAKATYRLHEAMRSHGMASRMFVRTKGTNDADVFPVPVTRRGAGIRRMIYRSSVRKLLLPRPSSLFNVDVLPVIDTKELGRLHPGAVDVACVHWITEFLGAESVRAIHERFRCPVVWVAMDLEPMTGGCHYPFGCEGFTRSCGWCPLLGARREKDLSRVNLQRKRRCFGDLPVTLVAPTSWVEERARRSSLFSGKRVVRIPLAIDADVFRPGDRQAARAALGVPPLKKTIFFASHSLDDPRKGMRLLSDALRIMSETSRDSVRTPEDIVLLAAGKDGAGFLSSLPFPRVEAGYLDGDARLALAYRAADLFVCPSVEDAGPMMIPEAMLCGTPVVAFRSGGAPDLVRTMETGYLAAPGDSGDLARGIMAVLRHPDPGKVEEQARRTALSLHAPDAVAGMYAALFAELSGR